MPKVFIASPADAKRWDAYVMSRPDGSVYHLFAWADVIRESFGHEVVYLAVEGASGIAGILPLVLVKSLIMPRALISLPFFNYAGILADSDEESGALVTAAIELAKERRVAYIEIRSLGKNDHLPIIREHKVSMFLDLDPDGDSQWKSLDPKVRNEVRKAEKNGLSFAAGRGHALDGFYSVYCRAMRDLGTPSIGKRFFTSILARFPHESAILVVSRANAPVAAAFTLCHGGVFQVPWAASLRSSYRFCPNEFMYWHAIRYAISTGAGSFDFGRSTKGSGTYRFKKQWGASEKQLYWHYWVRTGAAVPEERPQDGSFSFLVRAWKKLPLFIARSVGPLVARHLTTY